MKKKPPQRSWVYVPVPPKFTAAEKARIIEEVKAEIAKFKKLSQKVSRINMRGNRIYLYNLEEPFSPGGAVFIKPLTDDNFIEFTYARITLKDKQGESSTVDWQRHNDQWMTLYSGALSECLRSIEEDNEWFE